MADRLVNYTVEKEVAVLSMDDGKVNAMSFAMMGELDHALKRAAEEDRAVVLAGRPGVFSAGFDLRVMKSGPEGVRRMVKAGMELKAAFFNYPRPAVIACTGHALAGGAVWLLMADTRFGATGDFRIGMNEVAIGMAMPKAVSVIAEERLSRRYYSRSILEAEIYDPAGALDAGFLDRLASPETVVEAAIIHAAKLGSYPKDAYAETKSSLRKELTAKSLFILEEELASMAGPR